jgi:MinD-like ATPase involved in chromosome partitioning or flagellar assembly
VARTATGTPPEVGSCRSSHEGGTGKTFIATNLAAALGEVAGADVAVLDLDVDLGDVFAYFGKEPKRSLAEVSAEVARGARPDEMVELGMQLAKHVIGFGSPQDPGATAITPEATAELVRTLRSAFAYTVVDATCDYTDHVIQALELSDDVLFVTGLDVISVRHLSLGMRTLEDLGVSRDRMRVVLNRADSKVELSAGDIEDALGLKIDALIPSSASFRGPSTDRSSCGSRSDVRPSLRGSPTWPTDPAGVGTTTAVPVAAHDTSAEDTSRRGPMSISERLGRIDRPTARRRSVTACRCGWWSPWDPSSTTPRCPSMRSKISCTPSCGNCWIRRRFRFHAREGQHHPAGRGLISASAHSSPSCATRTSPIMVNGPDSIHRAPASSIPPMLGS